MYFYVRLGKEKYLPEHDKFYKAIERERNKVQQGERYTVKPPNRGHFGDGPFVSCREVVLFSEVLF